MSNICNPYHRFLSRKSSQTTSQKDQRDGERAPRRMKRLIQELVLRTSVFPKPLMPGSDRYINCLISTMPQRLEDCKKLKGDKTAWQRSMYFQSILVYRYTQLLWFWGLGAGESRYLPTYFDMGEATMSNSTFSSSRIRSQMTSLSQKKFAVAQTKLFSDLEQ